MDYNLVGMDQRFRLIYCLDLQIWNLSREAVYFSEILVPIYKITHCVSLYHGDPTATIPLIRYIRFCLHHQMILWGLHNLFCSSLCRNRATNCSDKCLMSLLSVCWMRMICGEIENISTHRIILKEHSVVTTLPRIISHKTFISRFSLSDFDIVVRTFVLILHKIVFFAAFYGSEYLFFYVRYFVLSFSWYLKCRLIFIAHW